MNQYCIVLKKCFSGFYEILQSLSGTFSLITLLVIAAVTFHAPMIGAAALAAFATVVPSILAYTENKETLQAAALAAQQAITNPTTIVTQPTVVNNITNNDNSSPSNNDLPPNGQS